MGPNDTSRGGHGGTCSFALSQGNTRREMHMRQLDQLDRICHQTVLPRIQSPVLSPVHRRDRTVAPPRTRAHRSAPSWETPTSTAPSTP
eukprot:scaffold492_cov257-Pinguiococcus_pyrenoidosus.AAC.6